MSDIKSHKELKVYIHSIDFVLSIYDLTKRFPSDEKFGLISQMRRAAVSIPSNISEGAARKNTKEFIQFLYISLGSAAEIETQIDIAKKLNYYDDEKELEDELHHIINMLIKLIRSLKAKIE